MHLLNRVSPLTIASLSISFGYFLDHKEVKRWLRSIEIILSESIRDEAILIDN